MDDPRGEREGEQGTARWENALGLVSGLLPAALAAAQVQSVPDAAHDLGVVRATGLGWTGAWRALDAIVASLFAWAPIGTRATRGGLAAAACAGFGGLALYALARRLVAESGEHARIGAVAAAIAATTATAGIAWQMEASSPGGSALAGVLALAPLALAARLQRVERADAVALSVAAGLALSYEPLVGSAGLLSAGAYVAAVGHRDGYARWTALRGVVPALAGAAALVGPPVYGWMRGHADPGLVLPRSAFAAALGEAGASPRVGVLEFARAELGTALAVLVAGGIALGLLRARARPLVIALLTIVAVGAGGVALGAPAGPSRWAGSTLAAIGAATALAAPAMQALVVAVARARIPFARASAAMIAVILLALPARVADDAWARVGERDRRAAAEWDEAAWGTVPAGAVALVSGGRALERIAAARATGALRGDLAVVPLEALGGAMAQREIVREPKLQPFVRDMVLEGAPEELSLSSLASARPVVMTYDARWEHALARHLVPAGLFLRFEPEPRGASDRRLALELGRPALERLAHAATEPRDVDLCAATASLLRARTIAWAAANDRELVARGLDELRPFSPDDRVASELARRAVTSKGPIDLKDLAP